VRHTDVTAELCANSKGEIMDNEEKLDRSFLLLPPRLCVMISTVSKDGVNNIAPYCEFTKLYGPYFAIGIDKTRDSLRNLRANKGCVVSLLPLELADKISISGKPYPPEVSEFEKTGLTPVKANNVKAPLVKEAIANYECVLHDIMEDVGDTTVVVVKVVDAHFDENITEDEVKMRMNSKAVFHVSKGRVFWSIGKEVVDTGIDHKVI